MGNPVVWFEIGVKEDAAATKFYADLFDWKINSDNQAHYGMVDTDSGGEGVGGGINSPPEGGPYTTFYVNCEDVQAKLNQAEGLGAKVVMPPMQIPDGPEIALFSDPDGNLIGLTKM
ncbi:MAG TPA: VOC family protein [Acidimicrobiia bacterium]|nr:VOC family protein [Acidimicrobiia bacterium]